MFCCSVLGAPQPPGCPGLRGPCPSLQLGSHAPSPQPQMPVLSAWPRCVCVLGGDDDGEEGSTHLVAPTGALNHHPAGGRAPLSARHTVQGLWLHSCLAAAPIRQAPSFRQAQLPPPLRCSAQSQVHLLEGAAVQRAGDLGPRAASLRVAHHWGLLSHAPLGFPSLP